MMTKEEKEILLQELISAKEKANKDVIPDAPAIKEIVGRLNSLSNEDKLYFEDFVTKLKADLFIKGMSVKGLNIRQFTKKGNTQIAEKPKEKNISRYGEVQNEFAELLSKLAQNLHDYFEVLKGYFITKLENDPLKSYNLIVLFDETFFIQPIKKKIQNSLPNAIFKKIEEFSEDIENNELPQENLLCLLLIHPRVNDGNSILTLKSNLVTIINAYESFESFCFKDKVNQEGKKFESSISKEDFFEEIEFVNSTLLSNGALKHEEEKIIKKLFRNFHTPLLIYKSLKDGNSGSKVVEIRPKKELGKEYEKRYIIKYGEKTPERKIDVESKCFGRWISGYKGFKDYECEYGKTLTHEGIRYSYAISDTESESYSFKEILTTKKNIFHSEKAKIVDSLFEIRLYQTWLDSLEPKGCKVSDLYNQYINIPKTKGSIIKILNIKETDIENEELFKNFMKIWNIKLEFRTKVCHGDLHTDNFFVDKNGTYLIDFGYTGMRHSIIDHTSLECSLRFKHFPFYIDMRELMDIEEELLLESSFNQSTRFTKTTRTDLLELLEIIKILRNNSLSLLSNTDPTTEYLISLFLMTFRQIRYKDMNQLYAYNSALLLSRKIIQLLRL